MHLRLRFDRSRARRWHAGLLRTLSQRQDTIVSFEDTRAIAPLPVEAERLFRVEALLSRQTLDDTAAVSSAGLEAWQADERTADLVVDLVGAGPDAPGARTWRLFYDGAPGEAALFSALAEGRSPVAELREGERVVAAGRLGTESPGNFRASFSDALIRTGTLICAALDGGPTADPMPDPTTPQRRPYGATDLGVTVARRFGGMLGRRLHRLRNHDFHWRVGWRSLNGPDLFDLRHHPEGGWIDLPDDGRRFYADPFPIAVAGEVTLFVEEYPHATGKGIISAVTFGEHGPVGKPEPVLDLPYHLSYPFVFERDEEIWMVPESCAAGRIDLFRATAFPGGWVKEHTLVDDIEASDATLVEHGGLWWLFATVKKGACYSDALYLWSAEDFRGPWRPHPCNPVLIDNASARPAGRLVEKNGVLWRPVQDCRRAYGGALGLARVTRLDEIRFTQQVETVLQAGSEWPGHLLHTVNRAGTLEFIDGSGAGRKPLFG